MTRENIPGIFYVQYIFHKIFLNFISTVTIILTILVEFETDLKMHVYKIYKIFIGSIHFVKIIKVFG